MSEPIASEVVRVTFFEDRAEVQRRALVALTAGRNRVLVRGVTPLLHDPSLLVGGAGEGARVVSARVLRRIEHSTPPLGELSAIEADLHAATRRREVAERALARAHADQTRSVALEGTWMEAVRRVPDRAAGEVAALRAALEQIDAAHRASIGAAHEAASEVSRARLDEERAEKRLQLARTATPRAVTLIEVQLEAEAGGEVELSLSYQTPCALWRPEHLARLDGERMEIRTFATVWQRTGEEWQSVACRFSTARPAQAASPPLLSDDPLTSRRKTPQERQTIVVEAREQTIQLAGVAGVRAVDEMPGVEDGGEPLWLEAGERASVPSDGQPVRIELARVELPCITERIAYPELTEAVHIRALATLTGKLPLLAGPVVLVRRSEAVGRGRTRFIGKGEPFELGFGVDDGLRVRRELSEQREVTPLVGTQKVTRTCELYVSNLSGETKRLSLVERIPVSEIDGLKVALLEWPGEGPDKDGFVRLELELLPGASARRTLRHRLEAPARVQLP